MEERERRRGEGGRGCVAAGQGHRRGGCLTEMQLECVPRALAWRQGLCGTSQPRLVPCLPDAEPAPFFILILTQPPGLGFFGNGINNPPLPPLRLPHPAGGNIYFDDTDATNLSVQDRQIGFVFQSYALFNHKTVAENIKFGLEVGGVDWAGRA